MKYTALGFCIVALLFFACKKDSETSGINYKLRTVNRSATISQAAPGDLHNQRTMGTITWTSGFASATEIEFEAETENTEVEFESGVNQKIDLFAPLSSLGIVTVPPGTYEEVEFEVHLSPTATDPALELGGTYNGTPIIFRIDQPIEVEAEFEDVTINQGTDFTAIITLNLSLLTQGISDADLNGAALTNGEIIISSNSNATLYNTIIANLKELDEVEFDED